MKLNINKGGQLGAYFYQKNEVVYGPIKIDALLEEIDGETLVYTEGNPWTKAKENPDLRKYFIGTSQIKNNADPIDSLVNKVQPENKPRIEASTIQSVDKNRQNNNWLIALVLLIIVGVVIYFANNGKFGNTASMPIIDSAAVMVDTSTILKEDDAEYQTLSTKYIDQYQLERIPYSDIINYENELLARHGFIFDDQNIKSYYSGKPWYKPENNYLMATSGFSAIEKSNFDLLDSKNNQIKNKIVDIIHSYYNDITNQTFDANNYYAERVIKYITKSNVTPVEINELNRTAEDFVNPKYQFIEPIEIKYERGNDGLDYFYFRVFFGVYRPSKGKFQSCYINLKWGIDANNRIFSNQELSYENLTFNDEDNFNAESPTGSIESNNWVVILGSFQNENDASELMNRCNTSSLSVELLNTNSFQYLTRNYFIVCGGKNLNKTDAIRIADEIKLKGFENYIKDAGVMQ